MFGNIRTYEEFKNGMLDKWPKTPEPVYKGKLPETKSEDLFYEKRSALEMCNLYYDKKEYIQFLEDCNLFYGQWFNDALETINHLENVNKTLKREYNSLVREVEELNKFIAFLKSNMPTTDQQQHKTS